MKKFLSILTLAVAVSGTAMATEDKPKNSPVGMAVVKSETGFKLFYKGNKTGDVTVKIFNEEGTKVYAETLKNLDNFMRPYNLNTMREGEYTVELSSAEGITKEKITFAKEQTSARIMNLVRLKDSDKYVLRIPNKGNDKLNIKVYDTFDDLVYQSTEDVSGDFAKLYNLEKLGSNFRFEVTDSAGETRQVRYTK